MVFRFPIRWAALDLNLGLFVESGSELRDDLVRGVRRQVEGLPAGFAGHQIAPEGEPYAFTLPVVFCTAHNGQVLAGKAEREVLRPLRILLKLRRTYRNRFPERFAEGDSVVAVSVAPVAFPFE